MKRQSSRELQQLFEQAGLQAKQQRHGSAAGKQQSVGPRSAPPRAPRGLASSSLARSSSLGSGSATASGGGSVAVAANHATRELPEVCSPPPSKPLNFLSELPLSPFAAASLKGRPGVPWQPLGRPTAGDRQQQVVHDGDGADHGSSGDLGMDADWQEREVLDDQENQQPGGGCAAAAVQPPATWLFSPVRRPGTRSSGGGGGLATPAGPARPVSAPRAIPSPLLSPTAVMSTPPKEALPAAAAPPTADRLASSSLAHAPSFGSWLVPAACRPPSPPPVPLAKPAVDVADVVAGLAVDCRAAQPFERGGPSRLDRLLAELGDSHYPASLIEWEKEELPDSEPECP